MSVTVTKNQIRPRRRRIRFDNAEILQLDTVGFYQLIPPLGVGTAVRIIEVEMFSNIQVSYGNIDADCSIDIFDDFWDVSFFENVNGSPVSQVSDMFTQQAPGVPYNMTKLNEADLSRNVINTTVHANHAFSWITIADIGTLGGIYMSVDNGGADFNGGDPANYWDLFVTYNIVNLIEG